jgi:hypothetical protein
LTTEEQKSLEERVQVLEEKITIEEQKNGNKELREDIARGEKRKYLHLATFMYFFLTPLLRPMVYCKWSTIDVGVEGQ